MEILDFIEISTDQPTLPHYKWFLIFFHKNSCSHRLISVFIYMMSTWMCLDNWGFDREFVFSLLLMFVFFQKLIDGWIWTKKYLLETNLCKHLCDRTLPRMFVYFAKGLNIWIFICSRIVLGAKWLKTVCTCLSG